MHIQILKPQSLDEVEAIQFIKAKEVKSGRLGHHFITRTNGIMRSVRLTVEHGMLIANGRDLLNMDEVEILLCQ